MDLKEKMNMIEVSKLNFAYGSREKKSGGAPDVLKDISFCIGEGESVGLIGANGVGKSTLLKLLVGLELCAHDELSICGLAVNKKNLHEVRKHVGYVFQDAEAQLFMRTVREDVAFAPRNYGYSAEEVRERTEEALRRTGTEAIADRPVYQLSGGEKKLASIATILSMSPDIILMDEGRIVADGSADEILRDRGLLEAHGLELPLSLQQRGQA